MNEDRRARWFRRAIAVGALGALGALGTQANAGVHIKRTLQPTGVDPNAQGQAVVSIMRHGGLGKMSVRAHRLDHAATFGIVVGGVRIGTLSTNARGGGRTHFSSQPGPNEQMLGVDPRGKHLEVKAEDGEDVLDGDIPDDTVQPGEMACCVPDDDGTECEDLTADECHNEGGMPQSAASCMPDPCATSPGQTTRCCLPSEDEVECEEVTPADCNGALGMDIGQGSCDPNPCMQPAPGVERCCIPEDNNLEGDIRPADDGGSGQDGDNNNEPPECEQLTTDHCQAEGGKAMGAGSCDPNPCVASASGAFLERDVNTLF